MQQILDLRAKALSKQKFNPRFNRIKIEGDWVGFYSDDNLVMWTDLKTYERLLDESKDSSNRF